MRSVQEQLLVHFGHTNKWSVFCSWSHERVVSALLVLIVLPISLYVTRYVLDFTTFYACSKSIQGFTNLIFIYISSGVGFHSTRVIGFWSRFLFFLFFVFLVYTSVSHTFSQTNPLQIWKTLADTLIKINNSTFTASFF